MVENIPAGLTAEEVQERTDKGLRNSYEVKVSRTYKEIVKTNFFNLFNLILFSLGGILFTLGNELEALAATSIIFFNVIVGTTQEVRAKRRLDKIALLHRPEATVYRNGQQMTVLPDGIVMDDIVILSVGDQALVDGAVLTSQSLEMDESLITGESSPRRKKRGDTVYSGSYCVAGSGCFRVNAVADDTYVNRLLSEAKKFDRKSTPLQYQTSRVMSLLIGIAVIYSTLILIAAIVMGINPLMTTQMIVITLDIIPIALFLLIIIAYGLGAVRMAGSGALMQRANAVESMSHVDTVCMDKTGTITTNNLILEEVRPLSDEDPSAALANFAALTGSKNRTIRSISQKIPAGRGWLIEEIPFTSGRKYSAIRYRDGEESRVLFFGAYDALRKHCDWKVDISDQVTELAEQGLRVMILTGAPDTELWEGDNEVVPRLKPLALISVRDEIRADCAETIQAFLDNNMDIKVISGDDPVTVDALFSLAGIPGTRKKISGEELDNLDPSELARVAAETNIFGRMRPDHKERIVESLKAQGRYVAMIGDGVNDVRSLKAANVGVALQSGSGAARGVADMVLLDDKFSALPNALLEGRRITTGMRSILRIYLARNFVVAFIILFTLIFFQTLPVLPQNNAFYALVSLSIPAFLMTVWAKPREHKGDILPIVLRFAIPASITIAIFACIVYSIYYLGVVGSIIHITFTPEQLAGSWNLEYRGSSPPTVLEQTAELAARMALTYFVTLAGITLVLLVAPLNKWFSVDGSIHKDIRPFILVILLYAIVGSVFMVDEIMYLANLTPLRFIDMFFITGMVSLWFLFTRKVLREDIFSRFTGAVILRLDKNSPFIHERFMKMRDQ